VENIQNVTLGGAQLRYKLNIFKKEIMNKLLYIFFTILLVTTGCRKDETIIKDVILLPEGDNINTTLYGFVTGSNGETLSEVLVSVAGQTTMTNKYGFYIFNDITVKDKGVPLTASKEDYITNVGRTVPLKDKKTFYNIQLSKPDIAISFNSEEGANIEQNQLSLTLQPNSFVDSRGDAYNGEILAQVKYYRPDNNRVLDEMPGNLEGWDKTGNRVVLGSFGMVSATFYSENNEELNLGEDQTAQLSMEIPGSLLDGSPSNIPIWSLDEEFGVWIEEGKAKKEDGRYVFDVSHFSFWNCDAPFPLTELTGLVVDTDGNPVINKEVNIYFPMDNTSGSVEGGNFRTRSGFTNDEGIFSGKVPRGKDLFLTINHETCGYVGSNAIGPFDAETANIDIVYEAPTSFYPLEGILYDCAQNPVANGLVLLYLDGELLVESALTDENGKFEFFNLCDNNIYEAKGIDLDNLKEANTASFEVSADFPSLLLTACDDLPAFVQINSDIGNFLFTDFYTDFSSDSLLMSAENGEAYFNIYVQDVKIGAVENFFVQYDKGGTTLRCLNNGNSSNCSESLSFIVSTIDEENKIVAGNIDGVLYSGDFSDPDSIVSHDISIQFSAYY